MTNKPQCCKTCVHSRWWLTATGRIKRWESGRCVAEFEPAILPACITQPFYHRLAIHPDDGADCLLYSPNEGALIADGVDA